MKSEHIFLWLFGALFGALTIVFLFMPRSTFSELERRELAPVPAFSGERLRDGSYTADVSHWFSDTEPFRDRFMTASMAFREGLAMHCFTGEDERVTFHASSDAPLPAAEEPHVPTEAELQAAERRLGEVDAAAVQDDGVAKVANAGIIVIGTGDHVRAMMVYGGGAEGHSAYAETLNEYARRMPGVTVYGMVIPTAIEYYCPESVRKHTRSQRASIANMYAQLSDTVRAVDVYTPLGQHAAEPIYMRTDHHWSSLGAYYAARKFAQVAKVPFRSIRQYDRHTVQRFVGTMYGYSKDISVKKSPEDFFYYTPKDTAYTTTYIDYRLDSAYNVVGESKPYKGKFFYKFKDGSGAAYQTFMGGDQKFVTVETGVSNGRRLVIIKDSFGNALPGWLFGSFERIYVVDFRYYRHDLKEFVAENGVTDILVSLNSFNAYSSSVAGKIRRLIH